MKSTTSNRLERTSDVCARTGLSRSTLHRLVKSQEFPAPVPLVGRTRAYDASAVDAWIADRIAAGSNAGKTA